MIKEFEKKKKGKSVDLFKNSLHTATLLKAPAC